MPAKKTTKHPHHKAKVVHMKHDDEQPQEATPEQEPEPQPPQDPEPPPVEEPPVEPPAEEQPPVETLAAAMVPPGAPPDPNACEAVSMETKCPKCGWSMEDPATRDKPHPTF